jgi:hypothetical protein
MEHPTKEDKTLRGKKHHGLDVGMENQTIKNNNNIANTTS